jgi:glycosyltransferase involved in cell wall biosynthesis
VSQTILSVAYPFARVGPAGVGGAEQILTSLEADLVARGYHSLVVARNGSATAGHLIETYVPDGLLTPELCQSVTRAHAANLHRALATHSVDLVHMHGNDFFEYPIPPEIPVLVTLHLPPSWYPEAIWHLPANYLLHCVSETQRLSCPPSLREPLPVIRNGVAISSGPRFQRKRNFALMLSRICPEKNLHEGIDAARLANTPVLLGGQVFPYADHLRYMREQIDPRLDAAARWVGPLNGRRKQRLLEAARCLLLPSLAPETSSLVAMEAIAAGTPVIAYPSGAFPEVVEHGRTGFLVRNVTEMAAAITRASEIDPAECRAVARSRFPLSHMVDQYIDLYTHWISSRTSTQASADR